MRGGKENIASARKTIAISQKKEYNKNVKVK